MEMLAEMEGSEEALMGLNNAEHKPEDEMQTDEWMYELKHRKSWATGMYVPSDENGPEEKLTLDSEHLENGGRAPPSWQEHLSSEQADIVIKSWDKLPKEDFGKGMHERLLKTRKASEPLNAEDQVQKIISTVDTAVKQILNISNIETVAARLNTHVEEYHLPTEDALVIFGDALLSSVAATTGESFSPEDRDAWGCAYKFIAGLIVDFEGDKE